MSSETLEDEDWCEPQRDERGRFKKGFTGNPDGRPRKQPKRPKSWAKCLAEAWEMEVAVNDNGTSQLLTFRELAARSIVRAAVTAKAKDMLQIAEHLERAAETAADEEPEEEIFTEEDRRLIEVIRRKYEHMCSQCGKLAPETPACAQRRDSFGFD